MVWCNEDVLGEGNIREEGELESGEGKMANVEGIFLSMMEQPVFFPVL